MILGFVVSAALAVSAPSDKTSERHNHQHVNVVLSADVVRGNTSTTSQLGHIERRVARVCAPQGRTLADRRFADRCERDLVEQVLNTVGTQELRRYAREHGYLQPQELTVVSR